MTLEGQGPGEDQTPAPPARTRWAEDAADDADVLLPPYVPGRGAPKPAAGAEEAPRGETAEAPPPPVVSGESESEEPWAEPGKPGSFAAPEPEAVAETVEPERAASVEPESEAPTESEPRDYPWDAAGSDEAFEPEDEAEVEPAPATVPGEGADPWPADAEGEDEFPFGAFDIEGPGEEARLEADAEPEGRQDLEERSEGASTSSASAAGADAMADRVERLAEALRREGRPGVEREIGSEDRLTSLLAGVLAGYLAGRED